VSHTFVTRTFTASANDFPGSFSSIDAYEKFVAVAGGEAIEGSEKLHHLWGATRSGWAIYTTKNILKSANLPSLQFLTDAGQQYEFEDEHTSKTSVAVFNLVEQKQVISDLKMLLSQLAANPDAVYDAEKSGNLCDGDVEEALKRDYVSANPALDPLVRGDEGSSADYLFVFLRSILTLFENANAEGLMLVHELRV